MTCDLLEQLDDAARLRTVLVRVAELHGLPPWQRDDFVQEVLCEAAAHPHMKLAVLAHRRGIDAWRRRQVAQRTRAGHALAQPDAAVSAHDQVAARELLERLFAGPRSLVVHRGLAWLLRHIAGEELAEIAATAGVTPLAVRAAVHRAREHLRRKLARLEAIR